MSQTCLDVISDCDQHSTNIGNSYAKCDDYVNSSSDLAGKKVIFSGEKSNIMDYIQ